MAKNGQNRPFQTQNDLKLHVLTQERLKITFFDSKMAQNDIMYILGKQPCNHGHALDFCHDNHLCRLRDRLLDLPRIVVCDPGPIRLGQVVVVV